MQPSASALLQELEHDETTHHQRRQIGEWLEQRGDPRPGIGVKAGLPEMVWLPVTPGGEVTITRVWLPDTPGEEAKVLHSQQVTVAPFYVAKYLVTYAQYQAFVEAEDGFENLAWWQGMPTPSQRQPLHEARIKGLNHPRDWLAPGSIG